MAAQTAGVAVRLVPVSVVRPLRSLVLRPNLPPESVHGAGDDHPDTLHFAAFEDDRVVGVMTLFPDPSPLGDPSAMRIRWMAVDPSRQRSSIGSALLGAGLDAAGARGALTVWANARDTALGFYLRHGFTPCGLSYIDDETDTAHTPVVLQLTTGDAAA